MKKIFALIISTAILLCGCNSTAFKNNGITDASTKKEKINTLEESDKSVLQEIDERNRLNSSKDNYIWETEDSYYYVNVYNNYTLCRYDKKTEKAKTVFDKNIGKFLVGIKVFQDELYFVTRTENDRFPCLYKSGLNGENPVNLIENVSGNYLFYKDFIYYTVHHAPNGDWNHIYRYNTKTKESEPVIEQEAFGMILVNDTLFYTDLSFAPESNFSNGLIRAIDLPSGKKYNVILPCEISGFYDLTFLNNKLYFQCAKQGVAGASLIGSYDLTTKKYEDEFYCPNQLIDFSIFPNGDIYCLCRENLEDQEGKPHYKYKIIKKDKDGETVCAGSEKIRNDGVLSIFGDIPIVFDITKEINAAIYGTDKLNIKPEK